MGEIQQSILALISNSLGSRQTTAYPILKRTYDVVGATIGLLLLGPVGLLIALIILLSDSGPIFYRQKRVGQYGRLFKILKFRSMIVDADTFGPSVTKDQDPRITPIGRFLRKTKLDELPQLWNVLKGEMSFVGPRPEVPRYVARYSQEERKLLEFKPGITDLATLIFRDEEALLRNASDVEDFYMRHCVPRKFRLNLEYARRASLLQDTWIILQTLCPYWMGISFGYALALGGSLWAACELRYDFSVPAAEYRNLLAYGPFILAMQMIVLFWRRQFFGLLSYFDLPELKQLVSGLTVAASVQYLLWLLSDGAAMPARSIILTDALVAFLGIAGIRTLLRSLRESRSARLHAALADKNSVRVGLVGAGEMGAWLIKELNHKRVGSRRVEVVFDDDPGKWNRHLHGIPVVGMPECILDGSWRDKLDEVIVAIGGASPERVEQIKNILGAANLRARIMPSLHDILSDTQQVAVSSFPKEILNPASS